MIARLFCVLLAAVLAFAPAVIAGNSSTPGGNKIVPDTHPTPAPVINKVTVDVLNGLPVLTIFGKNFGQATKPEIVFDSLSLNATEYKDDAVVVALPTGFIPGTYALSVTNTTPPRFTGNFVVSLG